MLAPSDEPTLTLTTCDPPGTADRRLIVKARLDESYWEAFRGVSGGD